MADEDDFPTELQDRLEVFDESLSKIENIMEPLHNIPLNELHLKMSALEKAKLDLVGVYAINSLFWMYMNANGENPKMHGIKTELNRIQAYMGRVKELEEKAKMSRVNKDAAKRFIRSALWENAQKKKPEEAVAPGQATVSSVMSTPAKRSAEEEEGTSTPGSSKKHRSHKKKGKKHKE